MSVRRPILHGMLLVLLVVVGWVLPVPGKVVRVARHRVPCFIGILGIYKRVVGKGLVSGPHNSRIVGLSIGVVAAGYFRHVRARWRV